MNWQTLGRLAIVIWMVVVAVLFFAQFAAEFDTAMDLIRRTLPFL